MKKHNYVFAIYIYIYVFLSDEMNTILFKEREKEREKKDERMKVWWVCGRKRKKEKV